MGGVESRSKAPSLTVGLTVDQHLQAGGTGHPGEVELAVSQIGAMANDGLLAGVELRPGTVEAQHPAVPHHHQTHPVRLGEQEVVQKLANRGYNIWAGQTPGSPTWLRRSSSGRSCGNSSIHKLNSVNMFASDSLGPCPVRQE